MMGGDYAIPRKTFCKLPSAGKGWWTWVCYTDLNISFNSQKNDFGKITPIPCHHYRLGLANITSLQICGHFVSKEFFGRLTPPSHLITMSVGVGTRLLCAYLDISSKILAENFETWPYTYSNERWGLQTTFLCISGHVMQFLTKLIFLIVDSFPHSMGTGVLANMTPVHI